MTNYHIDVVTEGTGMGKAIVIDDIKTIPVCSFKNESEEITKVVKAFSKSIAQLEGLKETANFDDEGFIDVHIMLLKDEVFKKEVMITIKKEQVTAQLAFSTVIDRYICTVKDAKNSYLQERYVDLADIKQRVLRNMASSSVNKMHSNAVLVVEELLPSMLMDFKNGIKGVVAKKGGYTSHAVILCRAREIPYVVIKKHNIQNGEEIVIDTRKQMVIQNPSSDVIREYEYLEMNYEIETPIINFNHYGINLLANISSNKEIRKVKSYNFDAIGLYRTEFIFMNLDRPLGLDEQYEIYHEAVSKMKEKPITFRTFDIGDDKQLEYIRVFHKGVDNYKNNPLLFETQVKALIKANEYSNMKILFPMIEKNEEFLFLRDWVLRLKEELGNDNKLEIGMMLETKQALENLSTFKEVDFISLGTNDLTAELYNISRDETLNYKQFIKDLIERLKTVVRFCKEEGKALSICGELASVQRVTKMLLKIGFKNLSVSVSSVKSLELAIKDYFQE